MSNEVSKTDEYDWKSLKRVLVWVDDTIEDKSVIGARKLSEVLTWIDTSYAVHNNMRSHTGATISMGYGIIHGIP